MYMRHVKARIVSWLQSGPVPVVVPTTAGAVIIAVYSNGRYVAPETVSIPDGVPANWGPDGPFTISSDDAPEEDSEQEEPDEPAE
jgi:hypothetical protein